MKCYLDKNQIERLASNRDVYVRGNLCFLEKGVKSLNFYEVARKTTAVLKVLDESREYMVSVTFDENGILQKYSCSCDASGIWRGACKHVVAAFLKIFEHNRESAVMSKSFRASRNLLDMLEKRAITEIDESLNIETAPASPVTLNPVFSAGPNGEARISLEVGSKRMYVVRNVYAFLEAVKNEETVAYGKSFEFSHAVSSFDKKSKELVRLLLSESDVIEKTGKLLNSYSYGHSFFRSIQNDRSFPLTPAGLDRFFALFSGESVKAAQPSCDAARVVFSDEKPGVSFKIEYNNPSGNYSAALTPETDFEPLFIRGECFGYILCDKSLHKTDFDFFDLIQPIFSYLKQTSSKTLYFSKTDLRKLNAFLLPALKAHGLLAGADDSTFFEAEPVKPVIKAYLDAENGDVTCRAGFCYGKVEIPSPADNRDGVQEDIPRNVTEEYRFLKNLSIMGFFRENGEKHYKLAGDDRIYDFYYSENGLARLRELAEVYATDAFLQVSRKPAKTPSFGLRLNGGLLEVSVDSGDFSTAELMDVINSYKLKKKYHKLSDGRFIDLDPSEEADENKDVFGALDGFITGLGISEKELAKGSFSLPKYRALYAGNALDENPLINASASNPGLSFDENVKALLNDFKTYKNREFDVPKDLEDILREYQKEGFKWLKTLDNYGFGGILADDMGLGKTIQVISVLLSYKLETPEGERKPSIVVAPTSLIYNWEKEIVRFAPQLSTAILSGPAAKRKETLDAPDAADVYITTYDMLKRDIENYAGAEFRYVIADEAQNIKNPGTQNAKAVKMLKADVRFALTGTPIENSLSELWSIFDFIMPGYLFNMSRFTKQYETPILKNNDKKAAAGLRRQISPFILRRLKADVLTELPEKVETTLYADMPEEQKKIYTAYLLKAKGELEETVKLGKYNESQIEILSMLTRLRQICCHPGTFMEDYTGGSGKLELTVETVKTSLESGHRLLIFSQFTKMLSILRDYLDREKIGYFYLDGATPSRERLDMADAFNSGEREVFLISLKAGGAGLNLTGADVVIHYDPWWNPAVMVQAADRAHRFGQKRTVQVINIVAKDSIEEKIIALQARKKDLVDAVIEEGANFITKLSQDEIMQLFKL